MSSYPFIQLTSFIIQSDDEIQANPDYLSTTLLTATLPGACHCQASFQYLVGVVTGKQSNVLCKQILILFNTSSKCDI